MDESQTNLHLMQNQALLNFSKRPASSSEGIVETKLDDGTCSILVCYLEGYRGLGCYSGSIEFGRRRCFFSSNTSPYEVEQIFGMPDNSWDDGVEKCYLYQVGSLDIEVVWRSERSLQLKYFSVEWKT